MIPFPDKQYDIIYADPPWAYHGKLTNLNRRQPYQYVEMKYPTMTTQDIANMHIDTITMKDCLLFLWVSSPNLPDGILVGESWGFKYITIGFVWDKQIALMGNYTMSECEICLIFKRGNIPQPRGKRNIRQFLSCRKGRHSEKPLEIKHRIHKMFPTQSKIELFARPLPMFKDVDDGWDYWGDQA